MVAHTLHSSIECPELRHGKTATDDPTFASLTPPPANHSLPSHQHLLQAIARKQKTLNRSTACLSKKGQEEEIAREIRPLLFPSILLSISPKV